MNPPPVPPLDGPPPANERNGCWITGCAVLLILAVLLGVGGMYAINKGSKMFGEMKGAMNRFTAIADVPMKALTAPEVVETLGEPVVMDADTGGETSKSDEKTGIAEVEMTQPITGPKGQGHLRTTLRMKHGDLLSATLKKIVFVRPDKTEVDLSRLLSPPAAATQP